MVHNPTKYLSNLEPDHSQGFVFDKKRADKVCNWLEKYITYTSAEWMGGKFELIPWQRMILRIVYGFVHISTGLRQYNTVFIFVPKKNGKTELLSGLALYHLVADRENSPEVYSIASDFEQAKLTWNGAKVMIENHTALKSIGKLRSRHNPLRIESPLNRGVFRCLSSTSKGKQGLRPSVVIGDEMHEWRGRGIYDALTHPNATMTRRHPLTFIITTAGDQEDHICNEFYAKALAIQRNEERDSGFLPAVWGIDDKEDWTNASIHEQVNPSWGYTVRPERIKLLCDKAQQNEHDEANFKRWSLNLFVRKMSRKWIPLKAWDECAVDRDGDKNYDSLFYTNRVPIYAGLDFAPKNDLTSLALVLRSPFDKKVYCKFHTWATQIEIDRKTKAEGIPFDKWCTNGWLEATPAKVFDPDTLYIFIKSIMQDYDTHEDKVKVIGYDGYRIGSMMQKYSEEVSFDCVDIPNTCRSLNEATTTLYNLVVAHKLVHYNDPLLRYCVANAHAKVDSNGLMKPDKSAVRYKIDPVMALVMALDCLLREESKIEKKPVVTPIASFDSVSATQPIQGLFSGAK